MKNAIYNGLKFFLRIVDGLFVLAVAFLACLTAGLFFARYDWRLDITCSFVPFYMLDAAACAAFLLYRKRFRTGSAALLLALYHAAYVAPFYMAFPHASDTGETLKVMTANMEWDSGDPERFIRSVRAIHPDLLALQEVTPDHFKNVQQLFPELPYHVEHVKDSVLGVALLSKYPIGAKSEFWLTKGVYATLMADIVWQGEPITVTVLHTVPPFNADWTQKRNEQLKALPAKLAIAKPARIVLGDFNSTMWSPAFRSLISETGLKNARTGFGVLSTFSSQLPIIPIDHCLYNNLRVVNCRRGPNTGSDHLPLIVEFDLNEQ